MSGARIPKDVFLMDLLDFIDKQEERGYKMTSGCCVFTWEDDQGRDGSSHRKIGSIHSIIGGMTVHLEALKKMVAEKMREDS